MKNSLYIIAALILILWVVVNYGFNSFRYIDVLLPTAAFIILLRIFYRKKSSINK